jgi:hypothetical protein
MWNLAEIKQYIESYNFDGIVNNSVLEFETDFTDALKNQLSKGIDGDGTEIRTYAAKGNRVYADFTVEQKFEKNQPADRVTLKDTGAFWNSFELEKEATNDTLIQDQAGIHIIGDNMDEIGKNLDLDKAMELTQQNINELTIKIQNEIQRKIKEIISNIPKI